MNDQKQISNGVKQITLFIVVLVIAGGVIAGIAFLALQNPVDDTHHGDDAHKEEGLGESTGPGYTIEEVPPDELEIIMPDLDRDTQFSASVPTEARTIIQNKIDTTISHLKEDSSRGDDWLNLGVLYHNANDYEGAREVWEFLTVVLPNNTVVHDNLGKLYHFTLRDFPKAEEYFQQSLEINPELLAPYLNLHELYRYSYKTETTLGADILEDAIVRFPGLIEIHLTLGRYWLDRGDVSRAREELLEGLNKARDVGNVDLIAEFGREIERLPQ